MDVSQERLSHHPGDKNQRARSKVSNNLQRNEAAKKYYVPQKLRFLQEPHSITSQKTAFFTLIAVKPQILRSINQLGSAAEK
jgi:hypothetical protein